MAAKLPPCDGAALGADGRSAYVFYLQQVLSWEMIGLSARFEAVALWGGGFFLVF